MGSIPIGATFSVQFLSNAFRWLLKAFFIFKNLQLVLMGLSVFLHLLIICK